jgi:hypothetical protein
MTVILTPMTKQHGKMVCGERGGMEVQSVTIDFCHEAPSIQA